jgi:hypothetical protein
MCELDENKYFNNILKFNKKFEMVYESYTKPTYDTISTFIKKLLCNFLNDIKLFPSLHFFEDRLLTTFSPTSSATHTNAYIYTNYNFYFEIKWLASRAQYYTLTDDDYKIIFRFYDTSTHYIINCIINYNNGNIIDYIKNNNEIKCTSTVEKELLKTFTFVKMIHPKLLFMYACVMNFNECEDFYKILNKDYNLIEDIKKENNENIKSIIEKYESKLKFIENENNKNKEKNERYIEELTSSQINIEQYIFEIEKLKQINKTLIRRFN